MKQKRIIVYLAVTIFVLMTLPSISAVESNTALKIKKSFINSTPEQIAEKIEDVIHLKLSNRTMKFLLSLLSLTIGLSARKFAKQGKSYLSLLFVILNIFVNRRIDDIKLP
jgi:hypothetical protein